MDLEFKLYLKLALKKINEVYKKGSPNLGCQDRAYILYRIIKNSGLKPEINSFLFEDDEGKKIRFSTHYVIVLDSWVYDCNEEPNKNPIKINKYKERVKLSHTNSKLVWKKVNLDLDNNFSIEDPYNYLSVFDEKFQKEVRPLMEQEYQDYIKKFT